jgi:hypothetical protein
MPGMSRRRITCRLSEDARFAVAALTPGDVSDHARGGQVPFIVDDILLTYIVLPYGQRLLSRGQDQLFNWLDSKLDKEGKKFANSLRKRKLSDKQVLEEVGQYVEKHRGTADTLASAAYVGALETASALPVAKREEEFLRVVNDFFLTPVVEMVKELEHPAVVPGFLTGTDWLTVIDVRTVPSDKELQKTRIFPRYESESKVDPARIEVWTAREYFGGAQWRPRIWLVRPMDKELADELNTTPGQLADALKELAGDEYKTAKQFAEALEHQPFVTDITRRHVIVQHEKWWPNSSPSVTGESDRIPWAESPDGAKAMLAALEAELGDKQDRQDRWRNALSKAGAM